MKKLTITYVDEGNETLEELIEQIKNISPHDIANMVEHLLFLQRLGQKQENKSLNG